MIEDIDRIIKTGPYAYMTGREKFWMYVDVGPDDDCWNWQGKKYKNGYGCFTLFARGYLAHRVSLVLHLNRKINDSIVLHCCDNPSCVNPFHLREGTYHDNMQDMLSKGRGNPAYGSRGWQSFLTEEQASQIKWLSNFTPLGNQKIADLYNIPNVNTVSRIKTGARWPHVKPLPVDNWKELDMNLSKLSDRAERGVIGGDGDER